MVGNLDSESPTDILISIPPEEYLDYDEDTLSYYIDIFLGSSHERSILGSNLFRSKLLFFDLKNQKLGIASQSNCLRKNEGTAITSVVTETYKHSSASTISPSFFSTMKPTFKPSSQPSSLTEEDNSEEGSVFRDSKKA